MSTRPSHHADRNGARSTLVFLHGAWVSSTMWTEQLHRFTPDYRVITIDLPGHGHSNKSPTSDYSLHRLTADLDRVLTDLQVTNPILIGLSFGGVIAHTYATQHPAAIRGLVLADTPRTIPPLPYAEYQPAFLFPHHLAYGAITAFGPVEWFSVLVDVIETTLGHQWLALTPAVREYAFGEIKEFTTTEFISVYDALARTPGLTPQSLSIPTLLVNGDHEPPSFRAQTRTLERSLPDVETVTIPDAGHLSNLDNPGAFNEALATFFADRGL